MKLVVVSPQNKHEYTVQWIEAHTPSGSLIICPGHEPIIMTLVAGSHFSFLLSSEEKKTVHLVRPGFLEVTRTAATALISQETESI